MTLPIPDKTWTIDPKNRVEYSAGDRNAMMTKIRDTLLQAGFICRRSDSGSFDDHDPGDEHASPFERTTEMVVYYGPVRERWVDLR